MPIYEYVCEKCGAEFEKLVPRAETKTSCEKCGSEKIHRKLSRFAAGTSTASGCCPSMGDCPSAGAGCEHGGGHGGHCCCGHCS